MMQDKHGLCEPIQSRDDIYHAIQEAATLRSRPFAICQAVDGICVA